MGAQFNVLSFLLQLLRSADELGHTQHWSHWWRSAITTLDHLMIVMCTASGLVTFSFKPYLNKKQLICSPVQRYKQASQRWGSWWKSEVTCRAVQSGQHIRPRLRTAQLQQFNHNRMLCTHHDRGVAKKTDWIHAPFPAACTWPHCCLLFFSVFTQTLRSRSYSYYASLQS